MGPVCQPHKLWAQVRKYNYVIMRRGHLLIVLDNRTCINGYFNQMQISVKRYRSVAAAP